MDGFTPQAPTFGKDQHYYPEARQRTPLQLELGDAQYARLVRSWTMMEVIPKVWTEDNDEEVGDETTA